jgi:hypothetical protein
MKPTKDSVRRDIPGPLDETKGRRIFTQRPVRPDLVVIVGVPLQDLPQVSLAKDDEVIEALAPDRSDQPLDIAILPR